MTSEEVKLRQFDLKDRTKKLAISVVETCTKIKKNAVTAPLVSQLVRAATSIGANYAEADNAQSRRDFEHKIALTNKEASETKYWLELVTAAEPTLGPEVKPLLQEATELHLIFSKILNSTRKGSKQ